MKILLVEDDKQAASYLVKGLRESGLTVDHASDGQRGLYLASVSKLKYLPQRYSDASPAEFYAKLSVSVIHWKKCYGLSNVFAACLLSFTELHEWQVWSSEFTKSSGRSGS
jgi:hypothetical protein